MACEKEGDQWASSTLRTHLESTHVSSRQGVGDCHATHVGQIAAVDVAFLEKP